MEMTVIEALVIVYCGWNTHKQKHLCEKAHKIIRDAEKEILNKHFPQEEKQKIDWIPK